MSRPTPRSGGGLPRVCDAIIALAGLVVSLPLLAVAALAATLNSPGPVLFRQQRVGKNGRPFAIWKLRTMRPRAGGPKLTVRGDERVTPVGRLLRRYKLDELPALWNVVRGEMSLVGPRPEVPQYVDLDDPLWQRVLQTRPGLTDPVTLRLRNEEELLAQVANDREAFYREHLQRFKLDGYVEYLERRTWRSDLAVLWRTLIGALLPSRNPPPTLQEIEQHRAHG